MLEPTVSLTTVLYNSAQGLRECLESVRPAVLSGFAQHIIVDNASPDNSVEIVKEVLPEARLLDAGKNLGFAGGCNYAWSHAKGRYWMLLNPDTIVPEDGLQKFVEWMDRHPELGAASPEIIYSNGWRWCPGRAFPSLSRALVQLFRLHLLLPKRVRAKWLQGGYAKDEDEDLLDVDYVPGAAMLLRREAVEAAGLLSEEVLIYGEDSEWCWRIKKAGWKIGVCSQILFKHDEGQSTLRTWGDQERTKRIWAGIYDSCRIVKGKTYTRLLMLVNTLSFALESFHPFRLKENRQSSRKILNAHIALLKG
jgi:hypothetical protein